MATPVFVGRTRLLDKARQAISGGLHVHLTGEAGTGKSTLARRISPDAVFIEHPAPPSDVLASLLLHAHAKGWWTPPPASSSRAGAGSGGSDPDDLDEGDLVRIIRKMGQKAATEAAVAAYRVASPKALVVFDNFDAAPAGVVRLVRSLSESATVVAVGSDSPKAHQKPFLFGCTRIEVKRLSARETEELVLRLIEPHPVRAQEKARVVRHLVEESQGLPAVVQELIKRGVARGDLSLRALRREQGINGFKTVDMTPGFALMMCLLMMFRGMSRGWGDVDLRIGFAAFGGLMMVARFFAFRAASTRRR
jgi:hypothetical protein